MKYRCAGLAVVLVSFVAFGVAKAEISFDGVLDPRLTAIRVDSVSLMGE